MLRTSLALLFVALVACAKTSGNASTNQTFDDCNDLVDALTAAYIRCGHDENTTRQEQLNGVANGNCAVVTSVRDHGALQNVCLGSLSTIDCTQLEAHNLDDSCKLQMIQPAPIVTP